MPLIAIELNDAALVAARAGPDGPQPLAPSPGCALLHEGRVLVGEEALRRSRIAPLYAQNRYWQQLGLDRLPWSAPGVQTHADLAHAQLAGLVGPLRAEAEGSILAVPPGYSREQLGLLAGIANETGVPVRGLVDLGLAACASQAAAAPQLLHLDVQLHQSVLTVLEHSRVDGALRRTRFEILPGVGLVSCQQSLIDLIATTFVRRTRFDPLHEAATEQQLLDRLPEWLARLGQDEEIEVEAGSGTATHRVPLARRSVVDCLERQSQELQRLVQSARPAGIATDLYLSAVAGALPGLADRFAALRDCRVTPLAPGAAACGALRHAQAILRPTDGLALVHRLVLGVAAPPDSGATASIAPAVDPEAVPTHVLHGGRAWPIEAQPLVLGSAPAGVRRLLVLPAGTPGLSRSHCTLRREGAAVLVEDHSTYGTFVNDERVVGPLGLKVGDVLRLGTPGVRLDLIRVLPGDGAP